MESNTNKNDNKEIENKDNSQKTTENNQHRVSNYKRLDSIKEENNDIGSECRTLAPQNLKNSRPVSDDTCHFQCSQEVKLKNALTSTDLNSRKLKIDIIDPKKNKKEPFFYKEIQNAEQNDNDNNINESISTTVSIKDLNIPKKMKQSKHFFYYLNERNDVETNGPILYVNPAAKRAYNPGDGESKNEEDYKDTRNHRCCGKCSICYCHLAKHQMFNCCISENLHCCCEVFFSYLLCCLTYTLFCLFMVGRCAYTLCRHR